MSEPNEHTTLSYRVGALRLGADEPATVLPPGIDRVVIEADVVTIDGLVRWPGCQVEIMARRVEANGPEPAVLDVSGGRPEPDFDPEQQAAAGQPGAAGGQGRHGGDVTIVAGSIIGALQVRSNGGAGGAGQGGGHGIQPPTRGAAKDGRFTAKTKFGLQKWKSSGPYGGKVLVKPALGRAYVAVAYGANGGTGTVGGWAGLSGQPGTGGTAGQVRILHGGQQGATAEPSVVAEGGPAGAPGQPGQPGAGGGGGAGGRNRLYWYSWPHTHEGWTTTDDTLKAAARTHRIGHRARTGPAGAPGGVHPSPTAEPGHPTEPVIEQAAAAELGAELGPALLALVLGLAERAAANDDDADGDGDGAGAGAGDRAEDRFAWLVAVTAGHRDDEARRVGEVAAKHLAPSTDEERVAS